jgi:hypothetical protein
MKFKARTELVKHEQIGREEDSEEKGRRRKRKKKEKLAAAGTKRLD